MMPSMTTGPRRVSIVAATGISDHNCGALNPATTAELRSAPIGQSGNVPGAGRYSVILGALLGKMFNPRIQFGEYVVHRSIASQGQPFRNPVHGHLQHFMQRAAEGGAAPSRAVSRLAISFRVLILDIRIGRREGFGEARRGNSLGK